MLSDEQRQKLREALIKSGSNVITDMLVRIDVEEAKAMVPEDHEQLSVRPAYHPPSALLRLL